MINNVAMTIAETFTLPSRGKIYTGKNVSDTVTLRSMTTEEEMRRLSHTESPYKTLCSIIDACMVEDIGISSYDMCIGDYQFLLYKLRTVTYGSQYLNGSTCPFCGRMNAELINLDELVVKSFDDKMKEEWDNLFEIELPRSQAKLKLKYQTPRTLDQMERDLKAYQTQFPESTEDMTLVFTLKNCITAVEGKMMDTMQFISFLKKLPMMDTNVLQKRIIAINNKVGVSNLVASKCKNPECGNDYVATFRITSEFFGPTI